MNFPQQLNLKHAKYAFYDLQLDNRGIAEQIQKELKPVQARDLLIVGCVNIARELANKGFCITFLAMSNDMKDYIRNSLIAPNVIVGDLNNFNHSNRFDAIICLGDAFSSITDDKDISSSLMNLHRMLKYGGVILLENLVADKLFKSDGTVVKKVEKDDIKIKRTSNLEPHSKNPAVALWKVVYELIQNSKRGSYEEYLKIRGFTENEFKKFLEKSNFQVIKFLESNRGNSFVTIARK